MNWRIRLKVKGDGWGSDYASVDRLLKYLAKRKSKSEASRNRHCQILDNFCAIAGQTPDELVESEKPVLEELMQKFADRYDCPRTANNAISLLKTFFRANGFKDDKELQVEGRYLPTRYRKRHEYVPTLEEAIKMSECAGSLRDRAIILILISTALRASTLLALQYDICTDPLLYDYTIKNELAKGLRNIIIVVHEGLKKNVPNACKNRIPYYVFTSSKATGALIDYHAERQQKYGEILDDEPLFPSSYNQIPSDKRRYKFMSLRGLELMVKLAARGARIKDWKYVTPKSLRKVFESTMRNQPSATRIDTKDQEFFMGHILPGSQDAYYDRTKIEEMRTKYAKMAFEPSQVHLDTQLTGKIAEIFGINLESIMSEANRKVGGEPSPSDVRTLLKEKIGQIIGNRTKKKTQLVVEEPDLQKYFEEGWEVQYVLPSGKIVVCKSVEDGALLPNSGEQKGSVPPSEIVTTLSDSEKERSLKLNEIRKNPIVVDSDTAGRVGQTEEEDVDKHLSESKRKLNNGREERQAKKGQCNLEDFI